MNIAPLRRLLFIALIGIFTVGCGQELKVGGLYAVKNRDGSFGLVKVLALEPGVVHIRSYTNKFATIPTTVDEKSLQYFIGHAPISARGFIDQDKPVFVKQSQVSPDELEGYNYYKKAMEGK